jgi:hypothetical protein
MLGAELPGLLAMMNPGSNAWVKLPRLALAVSRRRGF